MTDPRKRFDTHKTVRMTAAFAKAIEREAKRQKISEGELMRRWMIIASEECRGFDKLDWRHELPHGYKLWELYR